MDIQEVRGSQSELAYTPSEQAPACPGCAAAIIPGDRFCQECGTRLGTSRSKRATRESNEARAEKTKASIICINCGTTNQPSSNECGDCKIRLIPQKERREESRVERNGLRGSLTASSRTRGRSANPVVGTAGFDPTDSSVSGEKVLNSNATDKTVSVEKEREEPRTEGEAKSIARPTKTNRKQRVPKFLRGADAVWFGGDKSNDEAALDYLYPSAKTTNANPHSEHFEQIVDETSKPSLFSLSAFLYNMESLFERIPLPLMFGILSLVIIIATANATTQWNRHEQRLAAIDKIATNAENDMLTYQLDDAINTLQELEKTEQGDLPPRARAILNQSLWLRSYAHAKKQQYAKALADLSMVTNTFISYDDVTEKSAEYKKLLAAHPEFADLSKDKGASNVASTDSSKSKSQAKQAPRGGAQLGAIQMETAALSSKKTKTDADDSAVLAAASERAMRRVAQEKAERANSVPFLREDREVTSSRAERESSRGERESSSSRGGREFTSAPAEREPASSRAQREMVSSRASQESLARVERSTDAMKTPQDKPRTAKSVSDKNSLEKTAGKSAAKRKSGKSDAALLDADMKRYSGLLVEYFSKAESGRAGGGQLTEPPSYEEWSEGGKRDF